MPIFCYTAHMPLFLELALILLTFLTYEQYNFRMKIANVKNLKYNFRMKIAHMKNLKANYQKLEDFKFCSLPLHSVFFKWSYLVRCTFMVHAFSNKYWIIFMLFLTSHILINFEHFYFPPTRHKQAWFQALHCVKYRNFT